MEASSEWYNHIVQKTNLHKDTLTKGDYKKYKLGLLLRIAQRVDGFSSICGECQLFQPEITRLTEELRNLSLMTKENRKNYFKTLGNITKHLQKQHNLVTEGHYIGIWMAIGTAIGVAIGAALGNPGVGPAIGIALGVAVGTYLDKKAKKEGRVI
ncbi:glycine zipper family protein [Chloroflexota bacterium]